MAVSKVIRKNTRSSDLAGRYGGEEFLLIFHFSSLRKLMPAALFKSLLYRMSRKFPLMGFVIEP